MISIAMATYNGEKYLREQLDSILAQTIQDFELIVCDDCSTDSTVQILNEYAEMDARIKVFVNERNLGLIDNFVKAIQKSQGEFIALSDQDDIWLARHLQILMKKIEGKYIVCGNELLIESKDKIDVGVNKFNRTDVEIPNASADMLLYIFCTGNFFAGNSMLVRKSLFTANVFPIPNTYYNHDVWFLIVACINDGFCYTDEIITYRRVHDKNQTGIRIRYSIGNKLKNYFGNRSKKTLEITQRKSLIDECKKRFLCKNEILDVLSFSKKYLEGKQSIFFSLKKWQYLPLFVRQFEKITLSKSSSLKKIIRFMEYFF